MGTGLLCRHLVAFAIRRNAQRFRRDLRGDHTPIPLTITERYRRAYGGGPYKAEDHHTEGL